MQKNQNNRIFHGWANYETWNIALWIQNDVDLYNMARMYSNHGYTAFVECLKSLSDIDALPISFETPDGVSWNDSNLDIKALDELLRKM